MVRVHSGSPEFCLELLNIFLLLYNFRWPHRLKVRTSPFHGGNRGSNPLGVTKKPSFSFEDEGFDF